MYSILIVDDDKNCRQELKAILRKSGVQIDLVIECSNGLEAMEVLEAQSVDVMLTDICMPKMNGIELVRSVQTLVSKPLMVAVSGHDNFAYAVEMMRMGVRDYILKPIDQKQLIKVIRQLEEELRQRQMRYQTDKNIGYQQLKYLIQNENISEKEIDFIIRQYQNDVFSESGYYICCLEKQNRSAAENNHFFYLSDIGGNDLYVVDGRALPLFCKNELQKQYLGISEIHFGLSGFKQAYEEAFLARKQAFRKMAHRVYYKNKENRIYFSDEKSNEIVPSSGRMEEDRIRQLAQMIGTDKAAGVAHLLKNLKRDIYRGSYSLESFEIAMETLIQTIQQTYQKPLESEAFHLERFQKIYQFACLEEYIDKLTEAISLLQEKIQDQFDDYKNKKKVTQAVRYMEENYQKDLNMAVVSNYVSMNYTLFSYEFKKYTGMNFVAYMKKIRIEKAKQLLTNTDLRINEICKKVGYENEKHFMKTFKSVCGVSPSEYRKNTQFND